MADPKTSPFLLTLVFRILRSLKVIKTDTDRSAIYDFLLTFRNNHGPISYRFHGINVDYSRKSHFFTPCILRSSWSSSLGIGYRR